MREGRRAHTGVMSGVGIRQAFDPDHIRHHPDVARPPPPSISTPHQRRESVGEGGRRVGEWTVQGTLTLHCFAWGSIPHVTCTPINTLLTVYIALVYIPLLFTGNCF